MWPSDLNSLHLLLPPMEIFGVSLPGLLSQLLLGLVNGSFYAILSLGPVSYTHLRAHET